MATISSTAGGCGIAPPPHPACGRRGLDPGTAERGDGAIERGRAYALGVAGFVMKPFEPTVLVALLSGVIERTAAA